MGIIKRQGIKSTLVNYLSLIVSAAAILFIYPGNDKIYGHALWIFNIASVLITFSSGGVLSLIVKYFPTYSKDDPKTYNGFLSLILLWLIGFFVVFLIAWFLFRDSIIFFLEKIHIPNASLIVEYENYILVLVGLLMLMRLLVRHSYNSLRTVVPDIIEKFGYKLFLPSLVFSFAYFHLSINFFTWGLVGFFALACIAMLVYLKYIGTLNFGRIRKPSGLASYGQMWSYAGFGLLNGIGTNLATRLDTIMIPLYLSMAQNGFYGKASFIANVLDYPSRSLNQIASPIISKAWEEDNTAEISMIYKKASANLFLIGCLVFLVIWYCLDDIVNLSSDPSTFPQARMIFLLLGISKLVDSLTSVNHYILVYSKAYRYSLFFLLFLGAMNVVLNFKLIPLQGIVGAAMATAISLFVFNVFRTVFIYFKFGLSPFSISNGKTFLLMLVFLGLYYVIPSTSIPLINILYKSAFVGFAYIGVAYFWRISDDANTLGLDLINRILNK